MFIVLLFSLSLSHILLFIKQIIKVVTREVGFCGGIHYTIKQFPEHVILSVWTYWMSPRLTTILPLWLNRINLISISHFSSSGIPVSTSTCQLRWRLWCAVANKSVLLVQLHHVHFLWLEKAIVYVFLTTDSIYNFDCAADSAWVWLVVWMSNYKNKNIDLIISFLLVLLSLVTDPSYHLV